MTEFLQSQCCTFQQEAQVRMNKRKKKRRDSKQSKASGLSGLEDYNDVGSHTMSNV